MLSIKKKYIVDERDKKVAVQLDLKTFERIERMLEDYVLAQSMNKNSKADRLELHEAQAYYSRIKKSKS